MTSLNPLAARVMEVAPRKPDAVCLDHDDDCADIADPVGCWMYQAERGICPLICGLRGGQGGERRG